MPASNISAVQITALTDDLTAVAITYEHPFYVGARGPCWVLVGSRGTILIGPDTPENAKDRQAVIAAAGRAVLAGKDCPLG